MFKENTTKKPKIDIDQLPDTKNALAIFVAKRPDTGGLVLVLISEDGAISGNVDEVLGAINQAITIEQKKSNTAAIFNGGVV